MTSTLAQAPPSRHFLETMLTTAAEFTPGQQVRRAPARQNTQRRLPRLKSKRALTLGILIFGVYLFVVHSNKINIGSATIAIGLFAVLLYERPLRTAPQLNWYVAFLVWSLIAVPSSISPNDSFLAWVDAAKILLIMYFMFNIIRTPDQHRLITLAWLGMFALSPARGTLFNFLYGFHTAGRYAWNFQFANFNDMAALTLIPLALSLERLRSNDKPWVKVCALAGVVSLPFIILITQSRAGMLGLAAMLLFLLARSRYRKRLAVATCSVGLVALLFAPQSVWDRITGMQYLTSVETLNQSDSSAEQRYLIWQVAEKIIADNPIIGVGIGVYGRVHEVYASNRFEWALAGGPRDTHNTYLHVLAETGVVGLFFFLMIFVSSYYELVKAARSVKDSAIVGAKQLRDRCQTYQAALVGLSVCAIFGSMENMVFPFLLVALAAASVRITWKAGDVKR